MIVIIFFVIILIDCFLLYGKKISWIVDPFSFALVIVFLSALLVTIHYWWEAFKPKWYKPHYGIRNGKLDYNDVKALMKINPPDFKWECFKTCIGKNKKIFSCIRTNDGFWIGIFHLMLIIVITPILIIFLNSIYLSKNTTDITNLDFGIIVTAIIGVGTIAYNIKLQARAKNRQEWIQEMRSVITTLLTIITNYKSSSVYWETVKDEYKKAMFHLELLINPSELEHRALLALIRKGAILSPHQKWGGVIPRIDEDVLRGIGAGEGNIEICSRQMPGGATCSRNPSLETLCCNCQKRRENISYVIRLSNLVLKREWEQVKYIR